MIRLLIVFVCSINILFAQERSSLDQTSLKRSVLGKANLMASAFKSGDYKTYVSYLHPILISGVGGEAKMMGVLDKQMRQLKDKKVMINEIAFDTPTDILQSKNEFQCTISQHTVLKSVNSKAITYSTLIAISVDKGKSWKFIDTSNMDASMVRKLFPNLNSKIIIPPKQKPLVSTD